MQAAIQFKRRAIAINDDAANGKAIRILRQQNRVTQTELAEALGVSNTYLSDMEKGKRGMSEEMFNRAKEAAVSRKEKAKAINVNR